MTRAEAEGWLRTLTPAQLGVVECILRLMPNYRYDLSRFPPLDPVPEPGLASVIAMVEVVTARIEAGLA